MRSRWLFCCGITFFIQFQVILCQNNHFVEEPQDQEVNPGDTVDLRCTFTQVPSSEIGEAKVAWLKNGQLAYPTKAGYIRNGDNATNFSIRIPNVNNESDGTWECQAGGDDLFSRKAHVVVRSPPTQELPDLFQNLKDGPSLIRAGGDPAEVHADGNFSIFTCLVHDSNPAVKIKWWIGVRDITDSAETINQTGTTPKTFNTRSTLTHQFAAVDNGEDLRCEYTHPSVTGTRSMSVKLNVKYAPILTISQDPAGDVVEGQSVILTCSVQANPPATLLKWTENGVEMTNSNGNSTSASVELPHLSHSISNGNYTCTAANDIDTSRMVYGLSMKFPPSFTSNPQSQQTTIDQPISLFCDVEGNPSPVIQWIQNTTDGQTIVRGEGRNLTMNADYNSQGKYWCKASNTINDKENIVLSDQAELTVKGPPRIETDVTQGRGDLVVGEKGTDVILRAVYCSNPEISHSYWQREQKATDRPQMATISTNQQNKKYEISTKPLARRGCFEARLKVIGLDYPDTGKYVFTVTNEIAPSSKAVTLTLKDASNTALIVGIVVGIGGPLLIAVIALFCCYRMRLFCFSANKKSGSFDVEKREKHENGKTVIETTKTMHSEDNLKQNPLQTDSMYIKGEKKVNGTTNHNGVNGTSLNGDLSKKNGRIDGMPAEVLHYAQMDVDGPKENGGTPQLNVRSAHDYNDIRPTVL